MQKPTTFFSHSSQDKHVLGKLKELFLAKTGGSIDVFLSSDGQSIPFGRNWIHRVEQALGEARLMLVFVTPNSLRSNWLHFESGYAYSKGIQVVPVGFGVDLAAAGAPLNLLQGFNVTSEAGLNNLIAVANDAFGHSHAETFTADDLRALTASGGATANSTLGPHTAVIREIIVEIPKDKLGGATPSGALELVLTTLVAEKIEHAPGTNFVKSQGMTIYAREGNGPDELRFELDPAVADIAFPLIDRLASAVAARGMAEISVRFDFIDGIEAVERHHSLTGRLFDAGIHLSGERNLAFKNLAFSVAHLLHINFRQPRRGAAYLRVETQRQSIPLAEVRELMDLLFERQVLFFTGE